MRNRTLNMTVALVQILIVLSLQAWCYVPSAAQWATGRYYAACRHDHRLCGCSPERIAARTCCCCQTAPVKGVFELTDKTTEAGRHHSCCNRTTSPKRYLSAIPCGSRPDYFVTALDTSPFTRNETVRFARRPIFGIIAPASPMALTSRTIDPPDPPPKTTVLS